MKKPFYKTISFFALTVFVLLILIVLAYMNLRKKISAPTGQSSAMEQSVENKSEGYAFSVPSGWYTEESGTSTIVIYPNYSPSTPSAATCKIAMSVFPYAPSVNISDWITARLGADPTIDVAEQSSEDISIGARPGIKWMGIMNGMPTTIIYMRSTIHMRMRLCHR